MTRKTRRGLLMILTGNGKGKTTSAFGQALRAVGHGDKAVIIQFMKGSESYGEILAARRFLPEWLVVEQYGLDRFVNKEQPLAEDIDLARRGLDRARELLASGDFGLVVLDEINVALDFGLVSADEVEKALDARRADVDVMLTGRYAPGFLVRKADLVSEILDIKHHYAEGVQAREGLEF